MRKILFFILLSFAVFAQSLKDGFYRVEEKVYTRGYKNFTEITVSKGKITKVTFDKFDEKGALVSENKDYNQRMKVASGIDSVSANKILTDNLLKTQKAENIDAVAGATSNVSIFKKQVNFLIGKAKDGKTGNYID